MKGTGEPVTDPDLNSNPKTPLTKQEIFLHEKRIEERRAEDYRNFPE